MADDIIEENIMEANADDGHYDEDNDNDLDVEYADDIYEDDDNNDSS